LLAVRRYNSLALTPPALRIDSIDNAASMANGQISPGETILVSRRSLNGPPSGGWNKGYLMWVCLRTILTAGERCFTTLIFAAIHEHIDIPMTDK
jgi:hypothetical protein